MAESTLAISYTDLQAQVGQFLGFGRDATAWDTKDVDAVSDIIQSGLRQFYYPPREGGKAIAHDWSFLHPVTTLVTAAADYDYDLPDDFGGIKSDLTFAVSTGYSPIPTVSEGRIRALMQAGNVSGKPMYAAVRPKAYDATTGQRFEVLLWPIPDGVYNLTYSYNAIPNKLDDTNLYPLGGAQHGETILESCLSMAEIRLDDNAGLHHALFLERLTASIALDSRMSPKSLGYNGDTSDSRADAWASRTDYVTYNGVRYT